MKKHILDLLVLSNEHPHPDYAIMRVTDPNAPLPPMLPGQFVQLLVDNGSDTFLRRPISIHHVDYALNEFWLLIHMIGPGTRSLGNLQPGSFINTILPLGNSFTLPQERGNTTTGIPFHPLLVGGGVGIAPLLYLGYKLRETDIEPTFLLGARSASDLLQLKEFEKFGRVFITTEDASLGEKGYVTQHSLLHQEHFSCIYCCGPKPMMVAVARYAKNQKIPCEVSLENMMACGLGACLCCVEDSKHGNVCVCTEGPVFNINELKWQI